MDDKKSSANNFLFPKFVQKPIRQHTQTLLLISMSWLLFDSRNYTREMKKSIETSIETMQTVQSTWAIRCKMATTQYDSTLVDPIQVMRFNSKS